MSQQYSALVWNPCFKCTKNSNYVFILYSEKIFSNISNCFLTLENSFNLFQLFLYHKLDTVEKNLREFSRVRKHFWIFEDIFLKENTNFCKFVQNLLGHIVPSEKPESSKKGCKNDSIWVTSWGPMGETNTRKKN